MKEKITPKGLISSIIVVGSLAGAIFAVDARYFSNAAASDFVQSENARQVETDLQIINLEIKLLEGLVENNANPNIEHVKRLEFLKDKRLILEKFQLELLQQKKIN